MHVTRWDLYTVVFNSQLWVHSDGIHSEVEPYIHITMAPKTYYLCLFLYAIVCPRKVHGHTYVMTSCRLMRWKPCDPCMNQLSEGVFVGIEDLLLMMVMFKDNLPNPYSFVCSPRFWQLRLSTTMVWLTINAFQHNIVYRWWTSLRLFTVMSTVAYDVLWDQIKWNVCHRLSFMWLYGPPLMRDGKRMPLQQQWNLIVYE